METSNQKPLKITRKDAILAVIKAIFEKDEEEAMNLYSDVSNNSLEEMLYKYGVYDKDIVVKVKEHL